MKRRSETEILEQVHKFLDTTALLVEENKPDSAMLLLAQLIEVSGGLLDSKPAAAPGQGAKRFSAAIYTFFPADYHTYAGKLYKQWRCHTIHSLIPGKYVKFSEKEDMHLKEKDEVLFLVPGLVLDHLKSGLVKAGYK